MKLMHMRDSVEYDIEIDAVSGETVKWESERQILMVRVPII